MSLVAGLALAETAVESANIVGYTTVPVNNGYTMVGVQFQKVGGDAKSLTDAFDARGLAGFDEEGTYQTIMRVWNGADGYIYYGWNGSSGTDYAEDPTMDNKWYDWGMEEVDTTIPVGESVWLVTTQAGTLTFAKP